ncbi:MAG: BA14K family protein [Alphaproteobacteria bacterium]|nr:BA14K family protein [Alphaproteobacteria bacterium]
MAKFVTTIIASAALAATTLVPVSQSFAHDRNFQHYHNAGGGWGGGNGWRDDYYDNRRHEARRHHRKHKKNQPIGRVKRNDDGVILGIIGLAAGALITGAILSDQQNRRNRTPQRRYIDPAPNGYDNYEPSYGQVDRDYYPPAPRDDYAAAGGIEPWTNEWYRYCSQRYRSFKPATGTFRGYDGQDHFCVAR